MVLLPSTDLMRRVFLWTPLLSSYRHTLGADSVVCISTSSWASNRTWDGHSSGHWNLVHHWVGALAVRVYIQVCKGEWWGGAGASPYKAITCTYLYCYKYINIIMSLLTICYLE